MTGVDDAIAADITTEALRLTDRIAAAERPIRLMGGVAVWLVAPSVRRPPYARPYADLDFAAGGSDRKGTGAFFEAAGYLPEKLFNAIHGATRLNYRHPDGAWTIDLLFDRLEMSHTIDLKGRLAERGPTLDLADLLLTKLQIWEINRKDLGDIVCLLADAAIGGAHGEDGSPTIDLGRIVELTRADWGLCHTVERNLRRAAEQATAEPPSGGRYDPVAAVASVIAAIEASPKTAGWRLRARIGERTKWYETPEEVRHQA